jgi:uncharacterized Tic20 family protein
MAETNHNQESKEKVSSEQLVNFQQGDMSKEISKDARMWAMFCHLGGLAGLIIPLAGNIVAPLIIWQIKKDDFAFIDEQGKEAVNFQISMSLYGLIGSIACLITCVGAILIPFVVAPAIYIIDFVFLLIAAVKANNGHHYRYPLTIRFIK